MIYNAYIEFELHMSGRWAACKDMLSADPKPYPGSGMEWYLDVTD